MVNNTENHEAKIVPGVIVSGPFWPELVKVLTVSNISAQISLEAVGISTKQYYTNLISSEDASKIKTTNSQEATKYQASAKQFRLVVEANRIRLA